MQNQAARILTRSPRREHITLVLKQQTLAKGAGKNQIQDPDPDP